MRGILITLEGIDGSGKSTVAARLARKLSQEGGVPFPKSLFVFTAEPTESEAGKLLRKKLQKSERDPAEPYKARDFLTEMIQLEELFLFMADHAHHLATIVKPALDKGKVVISDRYSDSRAAYQGATLRDLVPHSLEWVKDLHRPWSVVPDLTILFAIDPALAMERCRSRWNRSSSSKPNQPDRFEREDFLREVEDNFQRLAELEPERFVLIDASRNIDEVTEETLDIIISFISSRG
jgi:dTMP kinase